MKENGSIPRQNSNYLIISYAKAVMEIHREAVAAPLSLTKHLVISIHLENKLHSSFIIIFKMVDSKRIRS